MKRNLFAVMILIILGVTAVIIAVSSSSTANAQEAGEVWLSSAEAPADSPALNFSAPDAPNPPSQDDALNGGDLVSWRITAAALKPRENDVSYTVDSNGSCTYVTAGDAITVWNIPLQLHNGSVVDTLRMYYYDTSGSNTPAWFTIYDLFGDIVNEWSVSSTASSGYSFNDSGQINHTIDYSVYSYLINWRPAVSGSTIQLCGFRVFYTPPPYGLGFIPSVFN